MTSARYVGCCNCGCLKKVSNGIVAGLERIFFRLGGLVGRNPWKTIGLCVLVCGLMGVGFINHKEERRYIKNYVPRGSKIFDQHEWITENFPGVRVESMIIEDENILTAESINAVYDMYESAGKLETETGKTVTDFCLRVGPMCQVSSILELWFYNGSVIRNLTDDDVSNTVNQEQTTNPEKFLGQIRRNVKGQISGASATVMVYLLDGNKTLEQEAMDWEMQLIHLVNTVGHPDLQNILIYSTRSYDDEAMGTMYNDLKLLFIGFGLVFLYLTVSIGQLSLVHHKIFLASAGLLSIGLAINSTYGFAFITGIMFGQIHQILPFMLLGIGVDDVFVIMEAIHNLTPKERMLPVDLRIAHTLKNAGVSITVTSVTDMAAFAIGSTTVIPALSTFCIYTAIGVFALYVLQATFFVACLTLDEKRKDSRRDACVLCFTHEDTYKPNKMYTFSVQHHFMKNIWGPALTKLPVKILILLIYLGLTCLNVWSCMKVRFDYDPNKYLPEDSYATDYVAADRKYFPKSGPYTELFCGETDYANQADAMLQLYEDIRKRPSIQPNTVDFWLISFQEWSSTTTYYSLRSSYIEHGANDRSIGRKPYGLAKTNITKNSNTVTKSRDLYASNMVRSSSTNKSTRGGLRRHIPQLTDESGTSSSDPPSRDASFADNVCTFLQTPQGEVYSRFVKINCTTDPKTIEGSVLTFRQNRCGSSECDISVMDDMRNLVDNFTSEHGVNCFVYSDPQYMYNESNQVLKFGLYRNLALAAVSVFVVTLILIANMWTSILVLMCVVCTMVDVAGTMYFMDIYLDMASGVILILGFGLAVDHSAHVAHCFMTTSGTGNDRLKKTLVNIGPAVFSGGFSTFLAFSILFFTTSYAFILFCRLFTLVVVFGLFHGLAVLPVILSLVGPAPYETQDFSDTGEALKKHVDAVDPVLSNGHCERIGLKDHPDKLCNGAVKHNGFLPHKPSDEAFDDSFSSETNSRLTPPVNGTNGMTYWALMQYLTLDETDV